MSAADSHNGIHRAVSLANESIQRRASVFEEVLRLHNLIHTLRLLRGNPLRLAVAAAPNFGEFGERSVEIPHREKSAPVDEVDQVGNFYVDFRNARAVRLRRRATGAAMPQTARLVERKRRLCIIL